jgi:hypothetical protein
VTGGQAAALVADFSARLARTPVSRPTNSGPGRSGSLASASSAHKLKLPLERVPGRCSGQRSAPSTISRSSWLSRSRASTESIPVAGVAPGGSAQLEDRLDGPDRLGPARVRCVDAAAARQTPASPACDDCSGDLPAGDATTAAKAGERS